VQVRYDEGAATHIGPEPCVITREGVGEASVGERIGQPLSHERLLILGADAVAQAEGNMGRRAMASGEPTRRGLRPWHVQTLLAREPGDLPSDHRPSGRLVRIGTARSRSR
jgi:hypothetical protein